MKMPKEFIGKIYIYWHVRHDFFFFDSNKRDSDEDYIFVGETEELSVALRDPREEIISSLEKQITKERAESQRRIELLQGKIQQMLALECQAEES